MHVACKMRDLLIVQNDECVIASGAHVQTLRVSSEDTDSECVRSVRILASSTTEMENCVCVCVHVCACMCRKVVDQHFSVNRCAEKNEKRSKGQPNVIVDSNIKKDVIEM